MTGTAQTIDGDVVRRGYADTRFGQIHVRRVAGDRVPLALLHRTPVASACFEPMLRLFAGRRAAIALDTPGFGQSFRPQGWPGTGDYARWFLAALDALGIGAFHLCAHHTGTHFAAEMAVRAPARVKSLLLNGVLYAGLEERQAFRDAIGTAAAVDPDGAYLATTWTKLRSLYEVFDPAILPAEMLGALGAIDGRNQSFNAILEKDFPRLLPRIRCPVGIVQAVDDPLSYMLGRIEAGHPEIRVETLGPAETAAPERQAEAYAAAALRFAATHDTSSSKDRNMTDRRFRLVKAPTGFDLEELRVVVPEPGPGEVLIRVHAVSLNRRDIIIRELTYPVFGADLFVPLSDAASEIVAVGEGVTKFAVGDRVCSTFFQAWPAGRIDLPAVMSAWGAGGRGVLPNMWCWQRAAWRRSRRIGVLRRVPASRARH